MGGRSPLTGAGPLGQRSHVDGLLSPGLQVAGEGQQPTELLGVTQCKHSRGGISTQVPMGSGLSSLYLCVTERPVRGSGQRLGEPEGVGPAGVPFPSRGPSSFPLEIVDS